MENLNRTDMLTAAVKGSLESTMTTTESTDKAWKKYVKLKEKLDWQRNGGCNTRLTPKECQNEIEAEEDITSVEYTPRHSRSSCASRCVKLKTQS